MSHAIDRYYAAANAAPIDGDVFAQIFLGGLSVKFDYNLDATEWDDALANAAKFAAQIAMEPTA